MLEGATTSVVGITSLQMGVFGGIIVGLGVSALHNKFYKIELPQVLSFFGGTRFVPIVSGLAYGCDTAAHIGCLDEGGETIAIVGNSLDICHPRGNKALEERILSNGGMMMSECAIRVKANPTRLVARSRLQAALSEIVILAQCPSKSGSLHTMSFARQYGKKCYAATFLNRTEANAGNYDLLDRGLCRALPEG